MAPARACQLAGVCGEGRRALAAPARGWCRFGGPPGRIARYETGDRTRGPTAPASGGDRLLKQPGQDVLGPLEVAAREPDRTGPVSAAQQGHQPPVLLV